MYSNKECRRFFLNEQAYNTRAVDLRCSESQHVLDLVGDSPKAESRCWQPTASCVIQDRHAQLSLRHWLNAKRPPNRRRELLSIARVMAVAHAVKKMIDKVLKSQVYNVVIR